MHVFLKSIGMSSIKTQNDLELLLKKVMSQADITKEFKRTDGNTTIEYIYGTSESTGIIVRGDVDALGNFHFGHYFPYVVPTRDNEEEEIFINKRVDTDAYTGMCEDFRIGMSLIFYIQNLTDCFESFGQNVSNVFDKNVRFAGLSEKGKILLPTTTHVKQSVNVTKDNKRSELYEKAKQGNPEAIEKLTIQDIDRYAMVSQRIKKEDILSIVDTSIAPFGSESDIYKVIGNIEEARKEINKETGEEIWLLLIECDGIHFDISINAKDLLGEPVPGRRFRGGIWVQGEITDTN